MRYLDAIPGEDFSTHGNRVGFVGTEEQPQYDAHSGNKWLCKAEMEMLFGVRLTSAMLDNGNMKNMLCFAWDKDMCLYKRQILLTRNLGPTDTSMKLTSGTDCDNPLATEATCSRCRC